MGGLFLIDDFSDGGKVKVVRSGVENAVEGENLNTQCHKNGGTVYCVTHFIAPLRKNITGRRD
jgi:hypothetical protein